MSAIDMTKVAGLQAVDTEGQIIGTLSVDDLTELVAANLVQSTKNEVVQARSASLMSEASTLAATDEYEDQLPQDANPAFVRTLDSSGNPKQTAIASLASVVGGLIGTVSPDKDGLMSKDGFINRGSLNLKTSIRELLDNNLQTGYYDVNGKAGTSNAEEDYSTLLVVSNAAILFPRNFSNTIFFATKGATSWGGFYRVTATKI